MELRDIEIFLTLATELHFGKTAELLHVSAARVSQAIKKQERGIGAQLFYRDSRNVRLTPVGEQLRDDLQPIYQGLKATMERARLAAAGKSAILRVGLIPSNTYELRAYWDAFRSRHPEWELRLRYNPFIDAFAPLRRGDIDVLITWFPVEEPDLTAGPVLFTEPRVLAVAAEHRLAERGPASVEALGDFGVAAPAVSVPEYWEDASTPFYTPSGRPVPRSPAVSGWEDMMSVVAAGEIVQPVYRHAIRYHARPDIAYLPLHDAPLARWGLVWRTEADSQLIHAFASVVRDLGTAAL